MNQIGWLCLQDNDKGDVYGLELRDKRIYGIVYVLDESDQIDGNIFFSI